MNASPRSVILSVLHIYYWFYKKEKNTSLAYAFKCGLFFRSDKQPGYPRQSKDVDVCEQHAVLDHSNSSLVRSGMIRNRILTPEVFCARKEAAQINISMQPV